MTLPAWRRPPDPPQRVATAAPACRITPAGNHSTADDGSPCKLSLRSSPSPSRAQKEKAPISNHVPATLTPMGEGRDDDMGGDNAPSPRNKKPRRLAPAGLFIINSPADSMRQDG